jgi:nicotinate-nucleotide adenylyltransferase
MVRLAVEGHPACAISDIEVRRPGTSYSIDTVRELRAASERDDEFFFLIGLDAFRELPTWKQADALLHECRFVVLTRAGVSFRSLLDMPLFAHVAPDVRARMEALDNGRERTLEVPVGDGGARVVLVSLPSCEATASEIRSRLQRRLSASNLLPAPVESYIMRHRLYQEGPDQTGK